MNSETTQFAKNSWLFYGLELSNLLQLSIAPTHIEYTLYFINKLNIETVALTADEMKRTKKRTWKKNLRIIFCFVCSSRNSIDKTNSGILFRMFLSRTFVVVVPPC